MTDSPPCRVCGSPDTFVFLERRGVPVHQHLLCDSPDLARRVVRGDLLMTVCRACDFVFNAAFDPSRMEYGAHYDNTQSCSPSFSGYLDELVDRLVLGLGVRGKTILEVGCGKGDFLRRLVDREPSNRGVGYDPSYVGDAVSADGRLTFERRFFGAGPLNVNADVVLSRHVIEHVPEPAQMVRSIRETLGPASHARVVFETPCIEWILHNGVIWDFFYEHCSLFSASSLANLFRRSGFAVTGVRHIFGDQYLWLEAEATLAPEPLTPSGLLHERCRAFAARERASVDAWRARIESLALAGPVGLWGAGAKGVTLANLVDPAGALIDCVVDVNPTKQGRFVPGSGHPIVAPTALRARGVATLVLMNANYEPEIRAEAALDGLQVQFVLA